jgi:DNA-binding NarL/FixJ family response regulator
MCNSSYNNKEEVLPKAIKFGRVWNPMSEIKVAILDDHIPIIDGYKFRLKADPNIEIVATANYGEAIEAILESYHVDVLILDVQVPLREDTATLFPVLQFIPDILAKHPHLHILVISMHDQRVLIKNLIEAGAGGYILKDDYEMISNLGEVVKSLMDGEMPLSKRVQTMLKAKYAKGDKPELSAKEYKLLSLFLAKPGIRTKQMAEEVELAHSTVRNALSRIYIKLGVNNQLAAVIKAQELGLLPPSTASLPTTDQPD